MILKYLIFLQDYKYEILLFIIPSIFITLKIVGLVISSFGSVLVGFTKKVDQIISKETYEAIGRNSDLIKYLNNFFQFDRTVEEKDLSTGSIYWHIFHYVMDYYYAQENVYDDLRKAIFIRNIIAANVISIIIFVIIGLFLTTQQNIVTGVFLFLLFFTSYFFYKIYISGLKGYHIKLVLTFIYIYVNVQKIGGNKGDQLKK